MFACNVALNPDRALHKFTAETPFYSLGCSQPHARPTRGSARPPLETQTSRRAYGTYHNITLHPVPWAA